MDIGCSYKVFSQGKVWLIRERNVCCCFGGCVIYCSFVSVLSAGDLEHILNKHKLELKMYIFGAMLNGG